MADSFLTFFITSFFPPVLAGAALGCGFVWSFLAIRTNGLWAPLVCHLVWDLLVMFVAPYPV